LHPPLKTRIELSPKASTLPIKFPSSDPEFYE
jgi:hypothetical protein